MGFGVLFVFVSGLAVMSLWNALIPTIFGLTTIGFWQAIGLMLLSRLLFGGIRPRRGDWNHRRAEWKQKMSERWQDMTPEKREQLKANWRGRCGNGRRGFSNESESSVEKA